MSKTIKTGVLYRELPLDRAAVDQEARTVNLSFSSEAPVERFFGFEILDHSDSSVDLSRLRSAAPLLVGHNPDDQVGVVENASIAEKRGVATVRFGKSTRAQEIFTDVLDGIRRNVSVGYRIKRMVLEEDDDGLETYRATSWTPLEVSIVSVPADQSVGVGRNQPEEEIAVEVAHRGETQIQQKEFKMDKDKTIDAPLIVPTEDEPKPDILAVREEAAKTERERVAEITGIARKAQKYHPRKVIELADKAIREGLSADQFRQQCFELISNVAPLQTPTEVPQPSLGMKEREIKRYSLCRAILGAAEHRMDGLEKEMSDEFTKRYGRAPSGFWVPPDVLYYRNGDLQTRDLTVGTATAGGNLVATNLLAASFIELLRNRMIVAQMGATILDGLTGSVAIPRQTTAATAYWTTEQGTTTESNAAFDQVTLTPKGVSAIQDYSKQLLLQSTPSIDGLVRSDLATVLALAQDLAAMHGTGADNQPTGVINTTGIGDVACGVNGAVPTWTNVVDLETKVATANADMGALGYVTNTKVRGILKCTEKAANTAQFIWTDGAGGMGTLNGYRAGVTNQVSSTLEKGGSGAVCSAIFFGNWGDLIIGQWGGLDVLVDAYTQAATRTIRIVSSLYTDIAVRHAASFACIKDALTA